MSIESVFTPFEEAVASIVLFQRFAAAMTRSEIESLQRLQNYVDSRPAHEKDIWNSYHAVSYPDPETGLSEIFRNFVLSAEDRQKTVVAHKKKQYNWLLAEAYEAYEKLINRTYAYLATKNTDFWPASDYGNISISEVSSQSYEWLLNRAQNKSDAPNSILSRIRMQLPAFEAAERSASGGMQFRLALALIEQLRHHIVHTAGTISDTNNFRLKVFKKFGATNNGNPNPDMVRFIDLFLHQAGTTAMVELIEFRFSGDLPIFQHNRFEMLTGYLISHARLLKSHISEL